MPTIFPAQLVAVYMDHKSARIMDGRTKADKHIYSKYESRLRVSGGSATGTQLGNYRSSNNEATEHHQEQHDTQAFYKSIATAILPYDEIYLFGPTNAKDEFQNYLLRDQHFRSKIIRLESTDYITSNQQEAQVREHFRSRI